MTFEKVIKLISRTLALLFVFAIADNFYLSQKGFAWVDGNLVLVKSAQASSSMPMADTDTTSFEMKPLYVLGDAHAPLTMYEFSSFGCTHCSDFHLNVLPKLKKDYIDNGKLKLIFVDFPIDGKSLKAAMLSRCMPEDKYFEFLNVVFKKQLSWGLSFKSEKILASYAEVLGVDNKTAFACMEDKEVEREIINLRQNAMERLQIRGTPAFLIRSKDGEEMVHGLPSYEKMQEILNKYLNFSK